MIEDNCREMTLDGIQGYFVPKTLFPAVEELEDARNDTNNLANAIEEARDLMHDALRVLDNA